ncbi:MAG: hypothetical protein J6C97_01895 [Clostridia bacterium]|nr:hypothetical protein [Clostridia bacterium]
MNFNLDKSSFDKKLFYYNDLVQPGADPGAIWVDEKDDSKYGGYFYIVTTGGELNDGTKTTGAYSCYKSKDFSEWTKCGAVNGYALQINPTDWPMQDFWAPEYFHEKVVENGVVKNRYYLYFNALSKQGDKNTEYVSISIQESRFSRFYIGIAVSDCPYGPFTLVDTNNYYDFYGQDKKVNANGNLVNGSTPTFNFYKYNPEIKEYFLNNGYNADFFPCIDVSPFLDPATNDFYCYFSMHPSTVSKSLAIWVVKMKDFITPDYSTMHLIAMPGYSVNTTDFKPFVNDELINFGVDERFKDKVSRFYYDGGECGQGVNEGAHLIAYQDKNTNKWLYYLTYSPLGFPSRAYSILQAVSTSPNGPFKKLNPQEGQVVVGILNWANGDTNTGERTLVDYACKKDLSSSIDYIAGTGHHTFVKPNGDIFAVYHAHKNPVENYDERGQWLGRVVGVDRVEFKYSPTLKYNFLIGESGDSPLPILYGNGPSRSIQPLPRAVSGYASITKDAKIECKGDNKDFLISDNFVVHSYYKNLEYTTQSENIVLEFNSLKQVVAIMLYNSCDINFALEKIKKITLYNNGEIVKEIIDVTQDKNNFFLDKGVVRYGGAIACSFSEILVDKIEIELSSKDKLIKTNTTIKTGGLVILGK